jgi:secreted trypsin-like serine protease
VRRIALLLAATCALALPASAGAVVGGRNATRPYPNMAALRYDGDFICGASLVSSQVVLTAAHCVIGDDGKAVAPSHLSFILGRSQIDGPGGETIGASAVTVHERYGDPKPSSHDVALVTLARAATTAAPIRLADPARDRARWTPGTPATVTGWGTRAFGDVLGLTTTNDLQEVQVPIVADADCASSYALTDEFDPGTMVCAGETTGFKDSCQGDSGGPLMVGDGSGSLLQVGVVSFGTGCGYPTQYGVYARVGDRDLHDWIAARLPRASTPAPAAGTAPSATTRRAARHRRSSAAARRARCRRAVRRKGIVRARHVKACRGVRLRTLRRYARG